MRLRLPQRSLSSEALKGAVILAAGALVLLVFAVIPFLWSGGLGEQRDRQQEELRLLEAKLAARVRAGGPALGEGDQIDAMFLPGRTAGTTLAAFQSLVNTAAAGSGLAVLRMQPLPADEAPALQPVRLAVDAAGGLEQFKAFLVGIESMLPLVIVTGFDIVPRMANEAASDPYPSESLTVSLRLEAYGWKGQP